MDWNSAIEDNRGMLKRIVSLLLALAALAGRLSGLPRPVRAFVLLILRPAEAVARDFVLETTQHLDVPAPFPACFGALQGGDSPADAMRLAQSFRILALLLDRAAERYCGSGRRFITSPACGVFASLLTTMNLARLQLFPATAQLAVERRDSS